MLEMGSMPYVAMESHRGILNREEQHHASMGSCEPGGVRACWWEQRAGDFLATRGERAS